MSKTGNTTAGFNPTSMGSIPYDWDVKQLKDVCEKIQDGNYGGDYPKAEEFIEHGVPFLTSKAIGGEGEIIEHKIDYISEEKHNQLKKAQLKLHDVLFTNRGANVGTIGLVDERIAHGNIGPQLTLLRANSEKVDFLFLKEAMKSFLVQYQIRSQDSGSAMNFFGIGDTSKFNIPLPPLHEQKAIAHVLGLMDSVINTNNRLVTQKELQKKWLLQKLLTRKKRLLNADSRILNDEWKTIKLGDLFEFIKSYSISRDRLTKSTNENLIYCIHYGDIHAFYETDFLDFSNQLSIPQIIDESQIINNKDYLKEGDIIMADASEDYKGVGEAIVVLNLENKTAVGGLHTIVLRDKSGKTESIFRGYLFASECVRNKLRTMATGTSVYSVTKSTLESLALLLPPVNEQKAIAQVLGAADKEIQLLKTKTGKLREQKRGLMQVLLTGKKRLKINI
jgi:type I restriction enzyme, S subunit